jgi:hypothetical protein
MQRHVRYNRRIKAARLVILLAMVGLCACSDSGGTLSGSLGDYYDLSFDHTRARLYSSDLAVEFVAADGQVPVRVSLSRGDGLAAGTYDLEQRGDITGQRDDTRIPRFISGTLELSKFSASDGAAIEGSFEAKFATGRDESTLDGEFATTLEVIEGPKGYGFDTGGDAGSDAGKAGDAGDEVDAGDASGLPD